MDMNGCVVYIRPIWSHERILVQNSTYMATIPLRTSKIMMYQHSLLLIPLDIRISRSRVMYMYTVEEFGSIGFGLEVHLYNYIFNFYQSKVVITIYSHSLF